MSELRSGEMASGESSLAAEQSLLGSMLISAETVSEVIPTLTARMFQRIAHQKVFEAIAELYRESRPIDAITVYDQLQGSGVQASYVHTLSASVPTAANAAHYAGIVKKAARLRDIQRAGQEIAALSISDDAEIALSQAEKLIHSLRDGGTDLVCHIGQAVDGVLSDLEQTEGAPEVGLHTKKLHSLDGMLGGLHPGNLIVIAARPGNGKTSLALTIAAEVAERGKNVLFATLEMTAKELTARLICMNAQVCTKELRLGRVSDAERISVVDHGGRVSTHPLWFDGHSRTVADIRNIAKRHDNHHGLDLLLVDYIQLLKGESGRSRYEQVSAISRELKQLAMEIEIPIVALSQLSRASQIRENKTPQLSDLRDSGSIEQDADSVTFIHPIENMPARVELIVAKNRHGNTGRATVSFVKQWTRFAEIGGR